MIKRTTGAGKLHILLLCAFALSVPVGLSAQENEDKGGARFTWFLYTPGPGFLGNFGVVVDGHRLYGTVGVIANFDQNAPFPAPIRAGVRWSYRQLTVWPEYFYFEHINTLRNNFLFSDYGEGFKLDGSWSTDTGQVMLSLRNRLFVGNIDLPVIGAHPMLYETAGLSVSLFRSTPVPDPAHSIFAELDGGLVTILNSNDIGYGINLSFPIKLFRSSLFITPRFDYAGHNNGSLLTESNAVGYKFSNYSSFDETAFFTSDRFLARTEDPQISTLAFATKIEGRWYFLEPLYIPGASDLYLKAFADFAYLTDETRLFDNGKFLYALGGGIGYEWTVVAFSFNAGYEAEVGFRFSLNVSLGF